MSTLRSQLFPLIIVLLFFVALGLGLFKPPVLQSQLIGTQLADLSLPVLNHPKQTFSPASYKGKKIMINVFATWCVPCVKEHPELMKLSESGKIDIIGIAWKDKQDKVSAWLKERGNPYKKVLFDEHGKATIPLGLTGVPETFIVDEKGVILFHDKSMLTDDTITQSILPLIEHAPVP